MLTTATNLACFYHRYRYRERTIIGSVSYRTYRNGYWAYRMESYPLLLYWLILHAMLQVQQLLTGCITQIKGWSRPVTRRARTQLIDHDTGGGGGAGVRMLTATLQPLIRPTCHTPALQPTHQTTEQTAEPEG